MLVGAETVTDVDTTAQTYFQPWMTPCTRRACTCFSLRGMARQKPASSGTKVIRSSVIWSRLNKGQTRLCEVAALLPDFGLRNSTRLRHPHRFKPISFESPYAARLLNASRMASKPRCKLTSAWLLASFNRWPATAIVEGCARPKCSQKSTASFSIFFCCN